MNEGLMPKKKKENISVKANKFCMHNTTQLKETKKLLIRLNGTRNLIFAKNF